MTLEDLGQRVSPHFRLGEFACPCGCGWAMALPELINVLEDIRCGFGPVVVHHRVAGGFRCPAMVQQMVEAGRCKSTTQHGSGRAADFHIPGKRDRESLEAIREVALAVGAGGVGIYPRGNLGWLHVDVRPLVEGAEPVTWEM